MRQRVVALIVIPTVAATVFGGMRVYSAVTNAQGFHQVEQLAVLGGQVTALAQALEDERDTTAAYAAAGRPSSGLSAVRSQQATTNGLAASVRSKAAAVGNGYPSTTQVKAEAVVTRVANLQYLRYLSLQGATEPLTIVADYSQAISDLFSLDDEIAQGSGNSGLVDTVRTLGSLSRMKDQASQQRAILDSELIAGGFAPDGQETLDASQAQQASELAAFQTSATLAQNQSYTDTVAGSKVDQAQDMEQRAVVLGNSGKPLNLGMPGGAAAQQWYPAMSDTINRMRTVERQMVDSIVAQSSALQRSAVRSAVIAGAVVLLVLVLVLLVTIAVARSMVRPLRRLRAGALEVAGLKLPEAVQRLETDGATRPPEIEPIGVDSADEIGEVARAFDQVHQEALRLAADEAMLRGSVNGMFVNLSRRTQSLVERQLRLIDRLEQTEQDAARLGNLFQMDHLATRMRRNSENLLVLAGHDEASRRWTDPAPVIDVLRAAVSEIEQYERIVVDVQPGVALLGPAVSDAMHLLAEILENATSFSAADTRVNVTGRSLTSGGFLIEIIDSGVGMTADELAHENWRLDNPPMVDISVSRRMGLFVVGRLAAKHNIRVRLRPSETDGLTALVWIPDSLIVPVGDQAGAWQRRAEIEAPAPAGAMPAGAMPAGAMPAGAMPAGAMPAGAVPAAELAPGTQPPPPLPQRQPQAQPQAQPQPQSQPQPQGQPQPQPQGQPQAPPLPQRLPQRQPQPEPQRQPEQPEPQPAMSGEAAQQSLTRHGLPQRRPKRGKAEPAPEPDRVTTPAAGLPAAAAETTGEQPAMAPAADIQPPWQTGSAFPDSGTPATGFPSPTTDPGAFPPPAEPAAGPPPAWRSEGTPAAWPPAGEWPSAGEPPAAWPPAAEPSAAATDPGGMPADVLPEDAPAAEGRPWGTPAGGFPSPATPGRSSDSAPGTPADGFPSPATPGRGSDSAPGTPSGLPARIPGAGPSPHRLRRGDDRPAAQDAGAGPATGPHPEPVVVPPAISSRGEQRLPIFDSIESEWFRSRGQHVEPPHVPASWELSVAPAQPVAATGAEPWDSPADEGWSAAEAAAEPAVGDVTAAGLPRRVPQANAVPGSVSIRPAPSATLARTPEAARSRLESFQEGLRQARAAIATEERPDE